MNLLLKDKSVGRSENTRGRRASSNRKPFNETGFASKMKITDRYKRQIAALVFFAILIFSDKSIYLSKYIVLYASDL